MASLLALARAEIEEAKRYYRLTTRMHILTLATSLAALFATFWLVYVLSILALLAEALAWWCRYVGNVLGARGEEGRRRALLLDAFGTTHEPLELTNLRARFSKRAENSATLFEDATFYASPEALGLARLRAHLQEGAFWSTHLYQASASRSRWLAFGIPVALVAGVALAWPLLPTAFGPLLARALVIFPSLLFLFDEFSRSLSWAAAAVQAERIDRRLQSLNTNDVEAALAIFGDYSVATASAPPIPTSIYERERDRLNELWRQRRGRIGK